jgi:histone H4
METSEEPILTGQGIGKGGQRKVKFAPGTGKGGIKVKASKRPKGYRRDAIKGITKPAIRRLARRGGVKRINGLIYEETRDSLKSFLDQIIKDMVTYVEHARRQTATVADVVHSLKKNGRFFYGFETK